MLTARSALISSNIRFWRLALVPRVSLYDAVLTLSRLGFISDVMSWSRWEDCNSEVIPDRDLLPHVARVLGVGVSTLLEERP